MCLFLSGLYSTCLPAMSETLCTLLPWCRCPNECCYCCTQKESAPTGSDTHTHTHIWVLRYRDSLPSCSKAQISFLLFFPFIMVLCIIWKHTWTPKVLFERLDTFYLFFVFFFLLLLLLSLPCSWLQDKSGRNYKQQSSHTKKPRDQYRVYIKGIVQAEMKFQPVFRQLTKHTRWIEVSLLLHWGKH